MSNTEFLRRLDEIGSDIEPLEEIDGVHNTILCRCKKCGYSWNQTPSRLINAKRGCPNCKGVRRKTHDEFVEELYKINPNITPMEEYVNRKHKILCRCEICLNEWKVSPGHLLTSKSGCPNCKNINNGIKKRKSPEKFKSELQIINSDIELLEEYTTSKTKLLCKCKFCGNKWKVLPTDLLHGVGCPACYASKGELVICAYLNHLGVEYYYDHPYFEDLYGVSYRLLRPDFIIPDMKIWIEYDGRQHFMPVNFKCNRDKKGAEENFERVKINDEIKNQYAIDNGWTLVRISYLDYDYIETILDTYFINNKGDVE